MLECTFQCLEAQNVKGLKGMGYMWRQCQEIQAHIICLQHNIKCHMGIVPVNN